MRAAAAGGAGTTAGVTAAGTPAGVTATGAADPSAGPARVPPLR